MRTLLAPMEGVIDNEMRDVLTRIGGYDRCVTEFIRVNDQIIPEHVFLRFCPELQRAGRPHAVCLFMSNCLAVIPKQWGSMQPRHKPSSLKVLI